MISFTLRPLYPQNNLGRRLVRPQELVWHAVMTENFLLLVVISQ
jgi:hypothetical protein